MSNLWRIKQLRSSDLPYISVLLVCCLVAWWPVSFFVYSLKNDALNYFLPVRYQVSEAISNGYWPFWSPYFNLGYPLHGDMQSGVWNPIVQFFSLFGPYTLRTLQYETILYVFISGLGMFYLLKYFAVDRKVCLLIAISYMLCGYNSDSAQFLNWISAASFLPFVILFAFRSINESSWKPCLLNGLFTYLFFVTSYPADFIILLYLLLIFYTWQFFLKKDFTKKKLAIFAKKLLVTSISFTLLSFPAILSYIQFLPLTERGSGASYQDAMSNPLHPSLFFSYLTPLPVWKANFASITDPLERNSYFGLTAFTFLIAGFLIKIKSPWFRFCKWGFILSSIFSIGEMAGLRPLTYYALPLMNTFRHPANARLFTIFFACMISAFSIQYLYKSSERKTLQYSFILVLIALIILGIWGLSGNGYLFSNIFFTKENNIIDQIKQLLDNIAFSDLLIVNVVLQLPFLLCIYLFLKKKTTFKVILSASILNSVLHTSLIMPFTVVKKDKAAQIQKVLTDNIKKGYPMPDLNSSIQKNSADGYKLFREIGALNMYNKKIGRIDYRITPSNLNSQNIFWNKNYKLRKILLQAPFLYKADTLISLKDSSKIVENNSKRLAFVNDYTWFDSSYFNEADYTIITHNFTPNQLDFKISSDQDGFYCLFQNFYPNWEIYIDGIKSSIIPCNISFMGFRLKKGNHEISFRYEAAYIKLAFLVSLISLFAVLFLELGFKRNNKVGQNVFPLY